MAEAFDVEFIDREERSARFLVRGVTPAFANGVRRAMIADVPTMSIEEVRVVENSSVMFDEMIATRLGLIPLAAPVGEFLEDDVVTLRLDVEGPATAYSGDLETADEMLSPADTNIPIIDLKAGQRLALEADAVLGSGRDHAKHQGGVSVGYRHLQAVTVEGDADEYGDDEPLIVRGIIEEDGELIPTESFDNDLRNRYPDKEVTVTDVPNAFVFHVETDGSFDVETLVRAGVQSLHDRADELEQAVQL